MPASGLLDTKMTSRPKAGSIQLKRIYAAPVARLRDLARKGTLTLVYAAHDEVHCHARVLRDALLGRRNA